MGFLKAYPADYMEGWLVGDDAPNPRNGFPEVMNPVSKTN
jgi:hypothetical protein